MLKEIGLSELKKLKISKSDCIFVARNRGNDELAPSKQLLNDFMKKKKEYEKRYGARSDEAHNKAFNTVSYEKRFREQVLSNPVAMKRLQQISGKSKEKDIYLVCYEGPAKACHRRILLRICEKQFNATIKIDGVEL